MVSYPVVCSLRTGYYSYWFNLNSKGLKTMARKIVFVLLLALQFAVVSNLASAYVPIPGCLPCQ